MADVVVGVGAVVLLDYEILLVKRGSKPCAGCWAIPGGRVEYGEPLEEAVKRELLEETNILAEPLGIIWVSEVLPGTYPDVSEHYVLIDFLMKPIDVSNPKPSTDALELGFFRLDRIPANTTKSTKQLVSHIRKIIETEGFEQLYRRIIPIPLGGVGVELGDDV